MAMATDGSSYGWGYNASGELEDNSTSNRLIPTKVSVVGGSGDLIINFDIQFPKFNLKTKNKDERKKIDLISKI